MTLRGHKLCFLESYFSGTVGSISYDSIFRIIFILNPRDKSPCWGMFRVPERGENKSIYNFTSPSSRNRQ